MNDLISRQAAIDAIEHRLAEPAYQHTGEDWYVGMNCAESELYDLPPAQPEQTDCEYCHEDSDRYVKPIEKNCHAFIRFGMNGWEISLSARGWNGSVKIMYCPMCGRELKHE